MGLKLPKHATTIQLRLPSKSNKICPIYFADNRELSYFNENFLEYDISQATIIYMCSTCFSDELLNDMAKVIERCPNIRYVLSLKAFQSKLPLKDTFSIECTWGTTTCYFYSY